MTSELKHAFLIGFYLYIPFVLIDVVVASTLMSMGMIMLPPSMISMPLISCCLFRWMAGSCCFLHWCGASNE